MAPYHEAAAQLVFMAFLHRIVNAGGTVDREYAIGSGRIDILVRWPHPSGEERLAFELKVWRPGASDPLSRGLEQLSAYLDRLGLTEGTLVIFDRRPEAPPPGERTQVEGTRDAAGRRITILRA